tara:strand:+ start:817 stop:1053 length:237 start_codon:yes stop_codon:yes gene_type:complete
VSVFLGVLGQVVEGVSGVNEGFAWNASSDEASPSGSFSFDDDGFEAELGGANGSDVAAGACADDKDLALFGLHQSHLT